MRRWISTGGTLVAILFSATSAQAVLSRSDQSQKSGTRSWNPSLRAQAAGHPAADVTAAAVRVQLLLLPQGLHAMLRSGLAVLVSSNQAANGTVELSIPDAAAEQAGLKAQRGTPVVVGRGTTAQIRTGIVKLRLKLAKAMSLKLGRLSHLTLTLRFSLFSATGQHLVVGVTGRY